MTFNSIEFFAFLLVVLAVYWRLPTRGQNRFLLAASYLFYGWWDWRFLGLLLLSTMVDFAVGRFLGRHDGEAGRKKALTASLVTNLVILGFFKYFGFFADSLTQTLDTVGLDVLAPSVNVVLPVGISFYTFQSMSYTFDVYRRELDPVDNVFDFALYVSYFPQLVAGPIERATRLMPQLLTPRSRPSSDRVFSGVALIVIGLTKKVVIADVAAGLVTEQFGAADSAGGLELLIAVYAFALQIYGDFSGYSDIARGVSRLLGIELIVNFEQPYLSTSITDFWRRWHISLSNWLRDYLYIPLGGNRKGARRTTINLMLTMLLGGLWHGAAWTFVVWGALHGTYLVVERRLNIATDRAPTSLGGLAQLVVTFHLVCLSWIFFRADGFGQAADVLTGIVTMRGGPIPLEAIGNILIPTAGLTLLLDLAQRRFRDEVGVARFHPALQGAFYSVAVVLVLLNSGTAPVPFVYFQF